MSTIELLNASFTIIATIFVVWLFAFLSSLMLYLTYTLCTNSWPPRYQIMQHSKLKNWLWFLSGRYLILGISTHQKCQQKLKLLQRICKHDQEYYFQDSDYYLSLVGYLVHFHQEVTPGDIKIRAKIKFNGQQIKVFDLHTPTGQSEKAITNIETESIWKLIYSIIEYCYFHPQTPNLYHGSEEVDALINSNLRTTNFGNYYYYNAESNGFIFSLVVRPNEETKLYQVSLKVVDPKKCEHLLQQQPINNDSYTILQAVQRIVFQGYNLCSQHPDAV